MAEVISVAIAEGATTISVADTVGYATPEEYASMFTELYDRSPQCASGRLGPLPR